MLKEPGDAIHVTVNLSARIGALIKGVGAHYTIIMIRNPQSSIGNCLGPWLDVCNPIEPVHPKPQPTTPKLHSLM